MILSAYINATKKIYNRELTGLACKRTSYFSSYHKISIKIDGYIVAQNEIFIFKTKNNLLLTIIHL